MWRNGLSVARTRINPYLAPISIVCLWLAVQLGIILFGPVAHGGVQGFGVIHGHDTSRYIDAAIAIMEGEFPFGKAEGFLGYDLFVAFFIWSGLGEVGVALAQSLLSLAAAFCLYRIGMRLCDEKTGLAAALIFVAYPEIQYWNFYLLSESLFVSMVVISLFMMVEARGWWQALLACIVVGFTSVIRPNGFIILSSALVCLAYVMWRRRRFYAVAGIVLAVVLFMAPAVTLLSGFWARYYPASHLVRGVVVANYPESKLVMPGSPPAGLEELDNPLYKTLYFISDKPVFFLKLASRRLWHMFIATRPYYSSFHNGFLLMTLLPVYILAAWGVSGRVRSEACRLSLVSLVAFQCLVVVLTFVDSDNRVLLVTLPVSFVFASRGAWRVWEQARGPAASAFRKRRSVGTGSPV